ncbi:WD40 repeat domain-containing protein [Gemmata massiliana]|uniref:WD40 repeat domain-containing protein n=1 Tax=Gemmata massiliana TaxID=1210884 RepID=UPI0013A6E742|nr:hypothetical protein [Gemmata massiliana]
MGRVPLDGEPLSFRLRTGEGAVLLQVAERREFEVRRNTRRGVDRLAFTSAGRCLVCRSVSEGIHVWDAVDRQPRSVLVGWGCAQYEYGLACTPEGMVAANVWIPEPFSNTLRVWDLNNQSERVLYRSAEADLFSGLAFDSSGTLLATNVGVFDVVTGTRALEVHLWGEVLKWAPATWLVAGACRDEGIQVTDVDSGEPVVSMVVEGAGLPQFDFSADGQYLAVVSGESVQVWDTTSWMRRRDFVWKAGRLACLTFSPDGQVVAVANGRGQILLWDWDL